VLAQLATGSLDAGNITALQRACMCVLQAAMESIKSLAATEDEAKHQHPTSINVDKLIIKWHVTSKKIDRASRYLFPITFLVFNVMYWLIYAAS